MFSEIQYLWFSEQFTNGIGAADYLQIRHWNLDGSLNQRSLAKAIMESSHLSVSRCFALACDHCLEEEAEFYWNQMEEHERKAVIFAPTPTFSWTVMPRIVNLVNLDTRIERERSLGPKSYYDDDLEALSYELKALEPEEKVKLVMRIAEIQRIQPEVMRLCLSLLDKNQQMEVCSKNPSGVLRSLLTWPYHHQFIPVANFLWNSLKESEFCCLISNLVSDLERWPEPEHVQLLKDFWEASPEPLKIYVAYKQTYGRLTDLFDSVARVTRNSVLFPIWRGSLP
ncbi:hypothetical protein AVEN_269743-1 [Araneus ventricosus]|uniref:Uncharacterized protein n=1 Tax=Araneus ventricosus TaxID=182803 RepID=A0A4Y2EHQ8_ARAVE|nr:hypothetical protein AVEN_269743-1 [Araneus ventricosus]